jgi:ABC-type multidrug transport system ATPase subunit
MSLRGPIATLDVHRGDAFAVMGPSGSGKSILLRAIRGEERPAQGSLRTVGSVESAQRIDVNRKQTPQNLAKSLARKCSSERVGQAMSALGLWDLRQVAIGKLSPGQGAACALLPCLASSADLLLVDDLLDALDPWTFGPTLEFVSERVKAGQAFLATTNRPDVAERLGSLIVLKDGCPRFAGTVREFLREFRPTELVVETDDPSTVASMADPFVMSIRRDPAGLRMEAAEGQRTAAQLLTAGYGKVKAIVVRDPSLEEALAGLG